jgi:hypothetical protein
MRMKMMASNVDYLRTVGRLVSTAAQVEERNQVRAAAEVNGITNPLMLCAWRGWQNDAQFKPEAPHDH